MVVNDEQWRNSISREYFLLLAHNFRTLKRTRSRTRCTLWFFWPVNRNYTNIKKIFFINLKKVWFYPKTIGRVVKRMAVMPESGYFSFLFLVFCGLRSHIDYLLLFTRSIMASLRRGLNLIFNTDGKRSNVIGTTGV